MARKPVDLELAGGKSPRQRAWEYMRANRKRFTIKEIVGELGLNLRTVTSYLAALRLGGYVVEFDAEPVEGNGNERLVYRLERDTGIEAPRLTSAGAESTAGVKQLAMWGTMHRLYERADFSILELVATASTSKCAISEESATAYVRALAKAGYLRCTVPAKRSRKPIVARYTLIPSKYSGPRAPMVQRTLAVFDPNENRVVWTDSKGFEHDQ